MPDSPRPKRSRKATNRVPTADKAVAEALAIVRDARDADVEIDWTQNPTGDRERELRLAIIRRIEVEEATDGWDVNRFELAKILADMANEPEPVKDEESRTLRTIRERLGKELRGVVDSRS